MSQSETGKNCHCVLKMKIIKVTNTSVRHSSLLLENKLRNLKKSSLSTTFCALNIVHLKIHSSYSQNQWLFWISSLQNSTWVVWKDNLAEFLYATKYISVNANATQLIAQLRFWVRLGYYFIFFVGVSHTFVVIFGVVKFIIVPPESSLFISVLSLKAISNSLC